MMSPEDQMHEAADELRFDCHSETRAGSEAGAEGVTVAR